MSESDEILRRGDLLRVEVLDLVAERDAALARATQAEARVEALEKALEHAISVLGCEELKGVFTYMHVHGYTWAGPVADMDMLRAALQPTAGTSEEGK